MNSSMWLPLVPKNKQGCHRNSNHITDLGDERFSRSQRLPHKVCRHRSQRLSPNTDHGEAYSSANNHPLSSPSRFNTGKATCCVRNPNSALRVTSDAKIGPWEFSSPPCR